MEKRVATRDSYISSLPAPVEVLSDTQGRSTALQGLLQRDDLRSAPGDVLAEAPYGERVDDAQVSYTSVY